MFTIIGTWRDITEFYLMCKVSDNTPLVGYRNPNDTTYAYISESDLDARFRSKFREHYKTDGDLVWEERMFTMWLIDHKTDVVKFINEKGCVFDMQDSEVKVSEMPKPVVVESRLTATFSVGEGTSINLIIDSDQYKKYEVSAWVNRDTFNYFMTKSDAVSGFVSLECAARSAVEDVLNCSSVPPCTKAAMVGSEGHLYFYYTITKS